MGIIDALTILVPVIVIVIVILLKNKKITLEQINIIGLIFKVLDKEAENKEDSGIYEDVDREGSEDIYEEPFEEVEEDWPKSVDDISVLSSPIAACRGEPLTPPLIIKVMSEEQEPLEGKLVSIEIFWENELMSVRNVLGTLKHETNDEGIASFEDIVIRKTGHIKIFVKCGEKEISTDDIEIFPPGLPIDFWNYKVGSPDYEERFDRILRFKP